MVSCKMFVCSFGVKRIGILIFTIFLYFWIVIHDRGGKKVGKGDFVDLDFLLIRKMKQGDEEAFDLFIHKYYKDILSYCNYHCIDKEYAEDLTQETFIRFFTKLSLYHHKGKTKNYLYTIANHLCIDYMKKEKEIPTEEEKLVEKIETGDQKKDTILNRITIESALKKLPAELKELPV